MSQSSPPLRPPIAGAVTWSNIVQQETTGPGQDGRLQPGYKITFTTAGGVRGSVFVEQARYSAANVRAAIAQHARELDEVQAMGGA